jgi:hypothetical protein
MKRILIFIFTIIASKYLYACDCKDITKYQEYNNADLVFIGEIIQKFDTCFLIKPTEIFKGNNSILDSTCISPLGNCLINPEVGETWLVYATASEKSIKISSCGYSRSFSFPFVGDGPPPRSNLMPSEKDYMISTIYFNKALTQLNIDIQNLRSQRQYEELEKSKSEFRYHLLQIKWLLFGIILFSLFHLIFILTRKLF